MSAQRRRELLDAAQRHDLVILEDDPYGSIYFEDVTTLEDTRPIKADDDGRPRRSISAVSRRSWCRACASRGWSRRRRSRRRSSSASRPPTFRSGVFDQRDRPRRARPAASSIASRPGCARTIRRKRTVMERALESHLARPGEVDVAARRLLPVDRTAAGRRRSRAVRSRDEGEGQLRARQRVLRQRRRPRIRAPRVLRHHARADRAGHCPPCDSLTIHRLDTDSEDPAGLLGQQFLHRGLGHWP